MIIKSGQDWNFDMIDEVYVAIKKIADEKYDLKYYPNQLEIITSEQMLDAYSSVGLPLYYSHWSFGEQFVKELEAYKRGRMGLAYEIVINSNPCIAYLMEENNAMMQALVIAHAAFGHNHFFANNYLFKQWTDAEGIIDYLAFAKKYIRKCEERYGADEVEAVIDAAHALKNYGVDKYTRPEQLSAIKEEKLRKDREDYIQSQLNEVWKTVPKTVDDKEDEDEPRFPSEPHENILYFIEKNAPRLDDWKREIIRIIRKISQYFYPQRQTQVMNEGCATFFHHKIMNDLHAEGILDDGAIMEFYTSHTNVIKQPGVDDKYYKGINPYALGFAMYQDIERISMNPTDEDREWFGKAAKWVGNGDWLKNIKWAIENFKDESFIQQFISPKVIRDLRMFAILDDELDPKYLISGIHNKQGYKTIRTALANQYNIGYQLPDIQVYDVDRWGDRSLTLRHYMVDKRPLESESTTDTLRCVSFLWGYDVRLESVDPNDEVRAIYDISGDETVLDIFLEDDA